MIIDSLFVFLLYICELISVANAAQAVLPPQKKPLEYASIPGCFIKEINKMLYFNESFSPQDGKSCVRYTCDFDGYTDIFGCSAQSFEGDCVKVPGNRSLPYPECCDGVDCSQGKKTMLNTNEEPKIENQDIPENLQTEDVNLQDSSTPKQEEADSNRSSKLLQIDEIPINDTPTNTKTEETQEVNSEISKNENETSFKNKIVEKHTDAVTSTSSVDVLSDIQGTSNLEVKSEAPVDETSNSSKGLPAVGVADNNSDIPSEVQSIKNVNVDPRVNNPAPGIHEDLTSEMSKAPEIDETSNLSKDLPVVDVTNNNSDIPSEDPSIKNVKVDPRVNNPAPEIHEDLTLESSKAPEMTENLETPPQTPNDVAPDIKEVPSTLDESSVVTDVKPENDEVILQSHNRNHALEDSKKKSADFLSTETIKEPSDHEGSSGSKDVENLSNGAETENTTAT